MASSPPVLRGCSTRYAVARRAGSSGTGMYPGVATAAPVDGRTACTPPHTLDTANRSCHGVLGERGSLQPTASGPPTPRTREPRFRECADRVHGLASPKLSHAAPQGARRPTINPEFPYLLVSAVVGLHDGAIHADPGKNPFTARIAQDFRVEL